MTDETANLILEHLRVIPAKVDEVRAIADRHTEDLLELKTRTGHLEGLYASISRRVDRMDGRLDRIEKRLGLIEV